MALTVALALALLAMASPRLAAQDPTFSGSTSVLLVEVPVQVVDRDGNPIRGLTADNFEIVDGRSERQIVAFDVVDRGQAVAAGSQQDAALPPAARRYFLFLFDLSFSNPTAVLRAREAAQQVLDNLHPTDRSAVATFTLLRGAELVLGFTTDRRQTALAIDTLGAPQLLDRSPDPLGLVVSAATAEQRTSQAGGGGGGREGPAGGFEQDLLDHLRDLETASGRNDRQAQEQRVQSLVRSMAGLAQLMRSVDGRKHVVYLSEGFDSNLLLGEGGANEDTNRAIESGELWNVSTDEMFGSGRLQNQLELMLEEFRRADCAVEAVDIGGLRAPGEGAVAGRGQEGLFAMARGTGGDLYRNFNDLGEAMGKMLDRTSVTYVLGFQPDDLEPDGEYRKLRVRLKDAPRGARLVHRPGYFAPRPPGERSAEERRLEIASQLLGGERGGGIDLAVLAVPVAVPGEQPAVSVFLEIDGPGLLRGVGEGPAMAEIYAYALDREGAVVDYFSQTLGLDLAQVGQTVRAGGVRFLGQLDLDPGIYDLRVLVRNGQTGVSGLERASVEVPSFAAGELALLPPLVPETDYDRWLMVRQTPGPTDRQLAYPFTLGEGQMFVPVARPSLAGGRPVNLGVFAYHAGSGELTLNAQLIDAQGSVVMGQVLPVHQRLEGDDPARLLTALDVVGVPEGDYTLTVGLYDSDGGGRGLAALPVHVEPGAAGLAAGAAGVTAGALTARLPDAGEAVSSPAVSRRDAVRVQDLREGYQQVLAQLSAGDQMGAVDALVSLERVEAAHTDDVLMSALRKAEMEIARRLAQRNPDALTPVLLLHMDAYLRHRDADQRLLARHSRSMVAELAELYVDEGGSPTSVAANVFTSLGGALQQSGLTATANSLFERALDLERNNEGALLALGCFYEKVGTYDQAVSYLKRLVDAHPANAEGWLRLGLNLERLGKRKDAVVWLRRALGDEAPQWVRTLAYQELALLEMRDGDLAAAEQTLRQGLERWPSDQRLRLQLAHILDRRGSSRAAATVLAELDASPPGVGESPRYLYNRWPVHVLETGHLELVDTASSRLPALAQVMSGLGLGGAR